MKLRKQYQRWIKTAVLTVALSATTFPALANEWQLSILPASLNKDNTIRLVGGGVQELSLAIQATKEITDRAATHNIELELDLPPGVTLTGNNGFFKFSEPVLQIKDGRTINSFDVQVANAHIIGAPGARIDSEWKNHSIFVSTPREIPAGQNYVQLRLRDGDYTKVFNWTLQIHNFEPPAQRPKRTRVGLWDYSYSRSNNEETAKGIARLFTNSGITFTQSAANPIYHSALRDAGILTGGNTHHDYFSNREVDDFGADGQVASGGYADPETIITLPKDAVIPGVAQLVAAAKAGDGIATFDYEPRGTIGFSPAAVAKFKQRHNVSDEDFKVFQEYVAKNLLQTFKATDPKIARLWKLWTDFRSEQTSLYVKHIVEAAKAQNPGMKVAVTPSVSSEPDSLKTLALGVNNAEMAQYADIIMPQIYSGYGAADAKLAMQQTASWRSEIVRQKAQTQLWPLLLVRYAGAVGGNSPQRLRQQMLGSMAHGGNGVMFYYPGLMDAPYWEAIARTTEDIAKYEDFYQDGLRVDEQFPLSQLPLGNTEVNVWPGYPEYVKNPNWSFTAHRLGKKVLLTLINLEEANDLVFGVDVGNATLQQSENVEALTGKLSEIPEEQIVQKISGINQWLVGPGQIGFVVLEQE